VKVGIIILCRFNSTRLPGKILKQIEGKEVLSYIIERLKLSKFAHEIIVATSSEISDDPIASFCEEHSIKFFRGSLHNVSQRFLDCALHHQLDYAVRVNGDNLFTDAELVDHAIKLITTEGFDFVSNVDRRTYPTGMSVEVVKTSFYHTMLPSFQKQEYKEHVTYYFYQHPESGNFKYFYNESLVTAQGLKLALDCEEDLNFVSLLLQKMDKPHTAYGWKEIVKLVKK
jgi:spore coat polysaccharide biosynthesis protein SpsF